MFWPDTQTGVDVEPARKTVQSAVRKYFTEGGVGVPPTVPGGDWFNQITNELLNVLAAAGIDPSKADDDQLLDAIKLVSNSTSAREALRRSYAEAGYTLIGSFDIGCTVSAAKQVILFDSTGVCYEWTGDIPPEGQFVPPGTDPSTDSGYQIRSGKSLRSELADVFGAGLVGGVQWKTEITITEAARLSTPDQAFEYALLTGLNVAVDVDIYISTSLFTSAPGQVIRGAGGNINFQPGGQLTLRAVGSQIHNADVNSNGATYCIIEDADDTLAYNCQFSGPVGHYVVAYAVNRPGIVLCKSIGKGQITPFVFSGSTDFKCSLNELVDHTGFGIQARWCKGGVISSNTDRNKLHKYSSPASNGQTTYQFTVQDGGHQRYGFAIQDDVGVTTRNVTSITLNGTTVEVVLSNASVTGSGAVAWLIGCDALESYQVNSGCNNVSIINNYSDGTGDSNIVVGADYHWDGAQWVLAPNLATSADQPYNTVVSGNTLLNAIYCNISVNNSAQSVIVDGNHCYYAGYRFDSNSVHDCNINCSAASSIINNDCHGGQGIIMPRAGIASIPLSMKNNKSGGETVYAAGNTFYGSFSSGHYELAAKSLSSDRRIGLHIDGDYKKYESILTPILASSWSTKPANDAFWTFTNSGSGWSRNTINQIIGSQCAATVGGSYVDCFPSFVADMDEGGIVKILVKAKGSGYVDLYTNFSGGTVMPERINITNELSWGTHFLYMSVKNFTTFFLRVGSAGSDVMYLQDLAVEFLPLRS